MELTDSKMAQVSIYADLLMRWNRTINLTAIREPEKVITRHFAESMYLTKFVRLSGRLLDVGSGAGFPGLALKIVAPELSVVLLEPIAKKRAFLKEVVRECSLSRVDVYEARVEEFCRSHGLEFDSATLRAVGEYESVLPATAACLNHSGSAYVWLTGAEALKLGDKVPAFNRWFTWSAPIPVPGSCDREIWCGQPKQTGL